MAKNKQKPETPEDAVVTEESTERILSGFDMKEYVAKPLDQNVLIHREITSIPAKKPNSQQYFKIHPDLEVTVDVVEWKDEGTYYLVRQDKVPLLFEQTKRVTLHVGMFLSGNPFLFPVSQPDERGNWNQWHKSASRAVLEARKHWVRIQPDRSINGYVVYTAEGNFAEPDWPDKTIEEYLSIAFADAIIDDVDHPVVKQLRGIA